MDVFPRGLSSCHAPERTDSAYRFAEPYWDGQDQFQATWKHACHGQETPLTSAMIAIYRVERTDSTFLPLPALGGGTPTSRKPSRSHRSRKLAQCRGCAASACRSRRARTGRSLRVRGMALRVTVGRYGPSRAVDRRRRRPPLGGGLPPAAHRRRRAHPGNGHACRRPAPRTDSRTGRRAPAPATHPAHLPA